MFEINKTPVSFTLIALSLIGTIVLYLNSDALVFGLHSGFLKEGKMLLFLLQIFSSQFLHGDILHFAMNAFFIYYFGSLLEIILGSKKYLLFFLFSSFIVAFGVSAFENGAITIGISGFCMALVSYYTLELRSKKNPDWKGGITALAVNIIVGFLPGISLWGHLFGAIAGIIFYALNKKWWKKSMVGAAV